MLANRDQRLVSVVSVLFDVDQLIGQQVVILEGA